MNVRNCREALLLLLGHQVKNVINLRNYITKQSTPKFFVAFDSSPENKAVAKI